MSASHPFAFRINHITDITRRTLVLTVAAAALLASACSPGSPTSQANQPALNATALEIQNDAPAPADAQLRIAVIPKGTTHQFWQTVHAGARKAQRELKQQGVNVEIIWKGPVKEDDREQQVSVVESFTTGAGKADGIVLAPLDADGLARPVREALSRTIPTVVFDSDLDAQPGRDFVSFVATDNLQGGRLAGHKMAELLNGQGKIVMLRYQQGSASTEAREQGFLDAISQHPGLEVISSNREGGATRESALTEAENLMAQYIRQADGVFCPNESTTYGMLQALEAQGLAGNIVFIGFDTAPELITAMRNGHINALVAQNPLRMGELAVKTMASYLRGQPVRTRIDTGVELISKDRLDEPDIQTLLNPPLDQLLAD